MELTFVVGVNDFPMYSDVINFLVYGQLYATNYILERCQHKPFLCFVYFTKIFT